MKLYNLILTGLLLGILISVTSCGDDEDPTSLNSDLILNLNGLDELGSDYVYEGWVIVDGAPVSTGTFSSVTFPQTFSVATADLTTATTFVLTIEPAGETGSAALMPANTKILSGAFSASTATLTINDQVGNFENSAGTYILATPTDNVDNHESGVWWLDNTSGTPELGLDLPDLTDNPGWTYEGWVVLNGTPITTGTFDSPNSADNFDGFSATDNSGPNFPGEDLLINAPAGQVFPTDIRGGVVVISVEPVPDNSAAPFTLKPIVGMVAEDAPLATAISAANNSSNTNVTGTAVR